MKRILALLLILAIAITGCAGGSQEVTPNQEVDEESNFDNKVAILFPGLIDDGSWNQFGYEGAKKLESEGYELVYTENVKPATAVEAFRNFAREGYKLIVGHSGAYQDAALQVGKEFPDAQFMVVNGTESSENVAALQFRLDEGGFLVGALAGLMTETGKVSFIMGQELPVSLDGLRGFEAGVKHVAPDVEVVKAVTGSWEDADKARETAAALINSGVDIFYQNLDSADIGVFTAAEDMGAMVIGQYVDQSDRGPNSYIGTMKALPGDLIYIFVKNQLFGDLYKEGVSAGVVSVGAYSDRVPEEIRSQLKEIQDDMAQGKITF